MMILGSDLKWDYVTMVVMFDSHMFKVLYKSNKSTFCFYMALSKHLFIALSKHLFIALFKHLFIALFKHVFIALSKNLVGEEVGWILESYAAPRLHLRFTLLSQSLWTASCLDMRPFKQQKVLCCLISSMYPLSSWSFPPPPLISQKWNFQRKHSQI